MRAGLYAFEAGQLGSALPRQTKIDQTEIAAMTRTVLEWAPLRVRPGVTEEQLLAAAALLQSGFISRQFGFLKRKLVRRRDGSYVDLVLWATAEAAEQAMHHAEANDTCRAYFALLNDDSATAGAGVEHLEVMADFTS
jgi:hypothetical protein